MKRSLCAAILSALIAHSAHAAPTYGLPEVLVKPSAFKGVHGLAVDRRGRLLAGSVVGASIYQVDIDNGEVQTLIGPDQGQADDIAIGPRGEMAWTGFYSGEVLLREHDDAPIRMLAEGLPGINSIAFNQQTGQLFASQVFLGDALWELDPAGQAAPRLIARDLGGFNGFEVGRDGWLYGPLWFKGQVVRINPADGEQRVVAEGFQTPAAVNFDSQGTLYAVDTQAGTLIAIDVTSGETRLAAQLATSLDNLAIDSDDRVFVSNMADNSIQQVNPVSGTARTITSGDLAVPAGLTLNEDGSTLYITDIFAFRAVDTASGEVRDLRRAHGSDIEYPSAVALGREHLLLSSFSTGTLQIIARDGYKTLAMIHGLAAPSAAVELADGSIAVAEMASGRVLRLSGDGWAQQSELASGLQGAVHMVLGPDGKLYLSEAKGFISRIDPQDGQLERFVSDLAMPEGLAFTVDGGLLVAETAARRLTLIDIATGERRVLAEALPIGLAPGPGMPPSGIPTGIAAGADGTLYFGSDLDNGLYRLRPVANQTRQSTMTASQPKASNGRL
jgi:sugar lactone lactonase YvrE